jgi:hypothetical protein
MMARILMTLTPCRVLKHQPDCRQMHDLALLVKSLLILTGMTQLPFESTTTIQNKSALA